jgi:hypothetical protein
MRLKRLLFPQLFYCIAGLAYNAVSYLIVLAGDSQLSALRP